MSTTTRRYEHAENLTPARPVNLRKHRWYDAYPLPREVQQWIDESREAARHGDLDPTPVDDLEVDHDPAATAALDTALDAAFGPADEWDRQVAR